MVIFVFYVVPRSVDLLSIDNFGQSYISVKWMNPNGTRRFIGVAYGKTQSVATVKINKNAHTQLDDLKADTIYNLTVYTRSGNRESISKTISIHTSELLVMLMNEWTNKTNYCIWPYVIIIIINITTAT